MAIYWICQMKMTTALLTASFCLGSNSLSLSLCGWHDVQKKIGARRDLFIVDYYLCTLCCSKNLPQFTTSIVSRDFVWPMVRTICISMWNTSFRSSKGLNIENVQLLTCFSWSCFEIRIYSYPIHYIACPKSKCPRLCFPSVSAEFLNQSTRPHPVKTGAQKLPSSIKESLTDSANQASIPCFSRWVLRPFHMDLTIVITYLP